MISLKKSSPSSISRLEWWVSVTLVVLVIVVHALVPRYEYQLAGAGGLGWVRVDRWTGQAIHRLADPH